MTTRNFTFHEDTPWGKQATTFKCNTTTDGGATVCASETQAGDSDLSTCKIVCIGIVIILLMCWIMKSTNSTNNKPQQHRPYQSAFLGSTMSGGQVHEETTMQGIKSIRDANPSKAIVLMFHAEWCGHCKTTKPEVYKAAETSLQNGDPLMYVLVDGDNAQQLTAALEVKGYPTFFIMLPIGGPLQELKVERTAAGIRSAALGAMQ